MTRTKVKLAYIVNDAARKATYNKRKKGLLKKVDELSTLCGIEACAIVYGPYESQPEIWPSPQGVEGVLSKFKTMPEYEKSKKIMNQESFMQQRVLKAEDKLKKQRKDNREKEMTILMSQCLNEGRVVQNNMSIVDLTYLTWLIDHNLKNIGRRLEEEEEEGNNGQYQSQNQIMNTQNQIQHQMVVAPQPPLAASRSEEMAMMGHGHFGMPMDNGDIVQRQVLMDETIPFGEVNSVFCPDLLP